MAGITAGAPRSMLAPLVAGITAAVAGTAASVAMVLRVLRLMEPSSVPDKRPGKRQR